MNNANEDDGGCFIGRVSYIADKFIITGVAVYSYCT